MPVPSLSAAAQHDWPGCGEPLLTGLPSNKSKCGMTDCWVWEKMKTKNGRCLLTLFCSCLHEEDH